MKTIQVSKAGFYGGSAVEDTTIVLEEKDLAGYGPKGLGELFQREGKQLAETLFNSLPGGTVEAIKVELDRLYRELNETS